MAKVYCEANILFQRFKNNAHASSFEYTFSNMERYAVYSDIGGEEYSKIYPLLKEIPELGDAHDDLMPVETSARIVIDNSEHSLGFQRRFSDLLDEYTIAEQNIFVSFSREFADYPIMFSGLEIEWAYKIDSVEVNPQTQEVVINIKNRVLRDKVITKEVSLSNFPNAPISSLGKVLPLVLGAGVPVICTQVSDTEHAISTTLGTTYPIKEVTQHYAKHPSGEYYKISPAATTSTLVIDSSSLASVSSNNLPIGNGIAFPLDTAGDHLITSVDIQLTGSGTDSNLVSPNNSNFENTPIDWVSYRGATSVGINTAQLRFTTAAQTNSGVSISNVISSGKLYDISFTCRRVSGTSQQIAVVDDSGVTLGTFTPTTSDATYTFSSATETGSSKLAIVQQVSQASNVIALDNIIVQEQAVGDLVLDIVECQPADSSGAVILDSSDNWQVLSSASINKSSITASIAGTSDFYATFNFKTPAVVSSSSSLQPNGFTKLYGIIRDTQKERKVYIDLFSDPSLRGAYYRKKNSGDWQPYFFGTTRHKARGVVATLSTGSSADSNGLGYSKLTLSAGYADCDLSKLQLACTINGLSISGVTAGYLYQILSMLYSSDEFDDTDIFNTHTNLVTGGNTRIIAGHTVGKTTRLQLTRELLRNSAAKLISLASQGSAKVALYSWGSQLQRVARLDDRHLKSFKISYGNRQTVVNNITASYKRNVLFKNDSLLLSQGGQSGFEKVLANQRLSGSDSVTIYGANDLSNASFPFIQDDTSISSIINFYLRTYEQPYCQVEFAYPFLLDTDVDEIMASQVVEIVSAEMPAIYGTSSKPIPPVYLGEDVIETSGADQIRAKPHRVQVQSKQLRRIGESYYLFFTGQLLNNDFNIT